MSRSHHTGLEEQTPSPSRAPCLAALGVTDGLPAHEVVVEAPPRKSTPSTAASHQATEFEIIDHRPLIEPRGDGFVGATSIVSVITDIFQNHYGGAYLRFSEIPIHIQNLWFEEFGKRFRWLPQHDGLVRANWEKRCERRLSDILHKLWRTCSCPQWIAAIHWAEMKQKFNSPSFQKTSNSAKRNRSQVGPSHMGGSISFSEHESAAEFTSKELYKRLHTFQEGPKKGEFVSDRSRKVLDEVEQIQQHHMQVNSTSSVASSSLPKEKEIFMETAEGMNKRRMFGVGSEGPTINQYQTTISPASGTPEPVEDLRKKIEEKIQQRMSNMKKKLEVVCKKRDDAISSVLSELYVKMGMDPPQSIYTDLSILDLDDEEDHDASFNPLPDHHPSPNSGSNPLSPPPPPPSAVASAQCAV